MKIYKFVTFFSVYLPLGTEIPSHEPASHAFDSSRFPGHRLPPFDGGGLSHFRVRLWNPFPHFTEHFSHAFHAPQWPSTNKERKTGRLMMSYFWCMYSKYL